MINFTKKNTHIIELANTKNLQVWQTRTAPQNFLNQQNRQQISQNLQETPNLYGTFNLGLHVQDNPQNVHQNRINLLALMQSQYPHIQQIRWLNQIHGDKVVDIDKSPLAMSPIAADAHITSDTGVALAIMTADCVPVMITTENAEVIGGIHAGWQGLAKGIIPNTIDSIQQKIQGENTTNWQAWVGACIARAHYEVDERVKNQVLNQLEQQLAQTNQRLNEADKNRLFSPQPQKLGHYLADLPAITQFQLQICGIKAENIHLSGLDSYSDPRFYSYRQQTEQGLAFTGRMATLIFSG